jgi:demethylmenaquinone methyltransferase/2-methoxy-6-polyprenyl-1,4-benzoquinol methylase
MERARLCAVRQELLEKRSSEIQRLFGRVAHRYDLLNRVLSLGQDLRWRRRVARRVAALAPDSVLDVCTGTGDIALTMPPGPMVIGADFSLPMLSLARTKAAARRRELLLASADALSLPLADSAVDAVTVAFGVRNFENLDRGLAELIRVLRPGGFLLMLEFSRPHGPLAHILRWWARAVPPRVGRLLSGDPEAYSYLPASVDAFADTATIVGILRELGLDEVKAHPLTAGVCTLYEGRRRMDYEEVS